MPQHKDITDPNLHEPKGASTASADTVYVSDGAGSGTWEKITIDSMNTSSIQKLNTIAVTVTLTDVSTASSVLVPVLWTSELTAVKGILTNAITVANSTVTLKKNGSSSISTATVTYSGSAKGDTYTFTLSAHSLVAGDYIEITTDGASTTASEMTFILEFTL